MAVTDGLKLFLSLDETPADVSGNGHNFSLVGSPSYVEDGNTYDFGQRVPCYALFVDKVAGAAYTPTDVTFIAKQSSGDAIVYELGTDAEIVNEALPDDVLADLLPDGVTSPSGSTGQFRVYFLPDASGRWYYRFKTPDENEEAARQVSFTVRTAVAVEA